MGPKPAPGIRVPCRECRGMTCVALFLMAVLAACSHAPVSGSDRGESQAVSSPATSPTVSQACPATCPEAPVPLAASETVTEEGQLTAAEAIPADYELDDVRNLPQDLGVYTSSLSGASLDPACRESLTAEFRKRYFSPWDNGVPVFDPAGMKSAIRAHLVKEWYGENRRKVPRAGLEALRDNCDLERLPSLNRRAVVTAPTGMRILPTSKPFFKQPDSFPFDMLQQCGVKLNEPLRILHVSLDGAWVFAETSYASGWIAARDVAYLDETTSRRWMGAEQVVVVGDFTPVQDTTGAFVRTAKTGTLLPLAREEDGFYEVYLAARDEQTGQARELKARVPKSAAQRHPLEFGGAAIARIGNQLIGTPYGWGELFEDRDCSALIRDFFLPFGIWLPRGSYDQVHSGTTISLSGKSAGEKARLLEEKGVPFLTLVYLKGHVMLYVGTVDGTPLVFHDLWGLTVKNAEGKELKQVIGKAIVSTLAPGSELELAGGPLIARVSKLRTVTDRCNPPPRRR
jgi:NLPC_P60 stabilising domain, N term/SH3 domain (SH3b1 type)/NlpC/P60 family/SH3 domain of SH3b2 type